MAAVQALLVFMNMMFGGSTTLNAEQQSMLINSAEYKVVASENPGAVSIEQNGGVDQAIVVIDVNEL